MLTVEAGPESWIWVLIVFNSAGAAGNFLASIEQLSVNAFKSVMDIDVLGSYNTLKATLPYLQESARKHRMDSKSRECIVRRKWPSVNR
jgi:NADP-dependent 3-hydroxy acid dehydrogenase YdfG